MKKRVVAWRVVISGLEGEVVVAAGRSKLAGRIPGSLVGLACGFPDGWPGWTYARDWLQIRFPPDHYPHCFVLVPETQCLKVVRHLVCRAFCAQVKPSCVPVLLATDSCQDQILLCQPCESTQPGFHDLYYQPSRCPI